MAQYKVPEDPDKLIQCPFDSTHMIRASRLPYHIMDCRKNHRHLNLEQCSFNARHWVPKAEMKHHRSTCPDRAIVEASLSTRALRRDDNKENSGSYFSGDCSLPDYSCDDYIKEPSGEDWDEECDTERRAFKWGEDTADDYFSEAASNHLHQRHHAPSGPLRLPHGAPQVLAQSAATPQSYTAPTQSYDPPHATGRSRHGRGHYGNGELDQYPATSASQRLPNTLPNTLGGGYGGIGRGRGRGYGTPQQVAAPKVGAAATNGYSSGSSSDGTINRPPVTTVRPNLTEAMAALPKRPMGRGRGYGIYQPAPAVTQNGTAHLNGNSDGDSSESSSGMSSGSSRGTSHRVPRKVNARPLFNPGATKFNPGATKPAQASKPISFPAPPPQVITAATPEDAKKQIRKCEKKLREIEALESKVKRGGSLNFDEESKLQYKEELLTRLSDLSVSR